jgi:hypothetical protein
LLGGANQCLDAKLHISFESRAQNASVAQAVESYRRSTFIAAHCSRSRRLSALTRCGHGRDQIKGEAGPFIVPFWTG